MTTTASDGAVADRVPPGIGAGEWAILAGNIDHLGELADWMTVLDGDIAAPSLDPDDRAFLAQAAEAAEALDWSGEPWSDLATALKERSDRKGKALFRPLRLALTGLEHGPDLAGLLPLIGRARAARRLSGETA